MSLKSAALKGVTWNAFGTIGYGVANLLVTMILARILTPHDFGIIELLLVFSVIADAFVDSGFSQAIIRDREAREIDFNTVFITNLLIAIGFYVCLFISAPYISSYFKSPILIPLSRVVFLTVIFNSISLVQNAKFRKEINFKKPAISSMAAVLISGVISIVLAFKGFGIWAIGLNIVLFSFFKMIFLWGQSTWRPSFDFSFDSFKKYFRFGSNLLIQGVLDKTVSNIESLFIGKIYTSSSLGYFSQAKKLDSYVAATSYSVVQRVTYPVLSKIGHDPKRLKEAYKKVLGLTLFVTTPIMFFVIGVADNVLLVLFGEQWLPATIYVRLWFLCGFSVALYSIFINVFLVIGKTRKLLKLSLIRQGIRLISIIILARISVLAIMYGILITTLISTILYVYEGGKQIGYSISEVFYDLRLILFSCILLSIMVYVLNYFYFGSISPILLLLIEGVIMFLGYLIMMYIGRSPYLKELVEILKISQ